MGWHVSRETLHAALGGWCLIAAAQLFAPAVSAAQWLRTPAISPDASRIALRHRGDLWVVSTDGGAAVPLVRGPHYESNPVWSPDGRSVAFASDRAGNLDIYVVAAGGGEPERLTFHSSDELPSAFSSDGRHVIFSAVRHDAALPLRYPHEQLPSTFQVSIDGGAATMMLGAPAEQAQRAPEGGRWLYAQRQGREMQWRKHEQSPANWDLWLFDPATRAHRRLSERGWENREPRWSPRGDAMFYLSERSGSFNVWRSPIDGALAATQVTRHEFHPVRSLSISQSGDICYSFDGDIYVLTAGSSVPRRVTVTFPTETATTNAAATLEQPISQFAIAPRGKSLALVARGDVFVSDLSGRGLRRLTTTPAFEADPNFSPDGRSLVYASERDGHWQIYSSQLTTRGHGTPPAQRLFESDAPTWLPRYSPDGRLLAFVEDDGLAVRDLARAQTRTLLPKLSEFTRMNRDGYDIQWHPDSRWLAFPYTDRKRRGDKVGFISAGGGAIQTVTHNAYHNGQPRWAPSGDWLTWLSDVQGRRNYGGDDVAKHVYATPLRPEAFSALHALTSSDVEERKRWDGLGVAVGAELIAAPRSSTEAELAQMRVAHVDALAHAITPDSRSSVWASKGVAGFDIWRKSAGQPARRLGTIAGDDLRQLEVTADGRAALALVDGSIHSLSLDSGRARKLIGPQVVDVDAAAERAAMIEHVGRYTEQVFYRPGFDRPLWRDLVAHYSRFASDAPTQREFSELVSELIGELNASHTEVYQWPEPEIEDETGALGAVLEPSVDGSAYHIAFIAPDSPLTKSSTAPTVGATLLAIDGHPLSPREDWHRWLNGKVGKPVTLDFAQPRSGRRWQERVVPLAQADDRQRFYHAWVDERRKRVRELTDGKLVYAHLQGMDDESFRRLYNEALSAPTASALIVDTRYNYGGWLHEELLPFLQGRFLFTLHRQGERRSVHPEHAWTKPSLMLINAANYSNGYENPRLYQSLGLGKLVGTPIAGTGLGGAGTQLAGGLGVSIANDLSRDAQGNDFEGTAVQPDVLVEERPEDRAEGRDPQLEKAVSILLGRGG